MPGSAPSALHKTSSEAQARNHLTPTLLSRSQNMENKNEMLCSYAALMLADAEIDITVTSRRQIEPYEPPP